MELRSAFCFSAAFMKFLVSVFILFQDGKEKEGDDGAMTGQLTERPPRSNLLAVFILIYRWMEKDKLQTNVQEAK